MSVRDSGIDELFAGLHQEAGAGEGLALELRNATDYAAALQDLEGYFVIDDDHLFGTVTASVQAVLDSPEPLTRERLRLALDAAGFDEVAYLRSETGGTQPGLRGETEVSFTTADGVDVSFTAYAGSNPADRPAHPGKWADDTGQLAGAYEHEVLP